MPGTNEAQTAESEYHAPFLLGMWVVRGRFFPTSERSLHLGPGGVRGLK
jgi:hypothetical protein